MSALMQCTWRRACCRIMVSALDTLEPVGAELGESVACCCSLCSISWHGDTLVFNSIQFFLYGAKLQQMSCQGTCSSKCSLCKVQVWRDSWPVNPDSCVLWAEQQAESLKLNKSESNLKKKKKEFVRLWATQCWYQCWPVPAVEPSQRRFSACWYALPSEPSSDWMSCTAHRGFAHSSLVSSGEWSQFGIGHRRRAPYGQVSLWVYLPRTICFSPYKCLQPQWQCDSQVKRVYRDDLHMEAFL